MEELLRAFYPQKATLPDKRREACDTVSLIYVILNAAL